MGTDPRPAGAVRAGVRLLPQVGRGWVTAFGTIVVWQGVSGVLYTIATGALISSVPPAAGAGFDSPPGRRLLVAAGAVVALFVFGRVLVPVAERVGGVVSSRFHRRVLAMVLSAGSAPVGVAHLEDPVVADRMALARGAQTHASSDLFVSALARLVVSFIACAASALVLSRFAWWAPLIVAAGLAVERAWVRRELDAVIQGTAQSTPELRRAGYFRDLCLTGPPAKEMGVFDLGSWSADRFRATWLGAMEPVWRRRRTLGPLAVAAVVAVVASQGAVAAAVVLAGLDGRISIGEIAVFLATASGMAAAATWSPESEWQLRTAAASVAYAVGLHRDFGPPTTAGRRSADGLPRSAVCFEGVSFRYPGRDADVLDGLDLEIPAGRSLAIVGLNGAGKTTLTKLLAGLYQPTAGSITVDGVDLGDLDPASWRRRLAVIFQDFTRYEVSAADNVGFGAPDLLGDHAALTRAAARAGANELVAGLPQGWETVLSRRFAGGTELSGGQWQRVALARCFAAVEAGASVLVLDEPTASLDVRGEAELFDRFLELTAELPAHLTTIVISHRFATVRRADRIAVLEGGRVIELGSHDDLVAAGGRYAAMFNIQAARLGVGDGDG